MQTSPFVARYLKCLADKLREINYSSNQNEGSLMKKLIIFCTICLLVGCSGFDETKVQTALESSWGDAKFYKVSNEKWYWLVEKGGSLYLVKSTGLTNANKFEVCPILGIDLKEKK